MIRSRGISERVLFAYNPLPKINEAELLKAAGLDDLLQASKRAPFEFIWKYGSGLQTETVELQPGDFLPLRESEAREFERATNALELGLCVVSVADPNNAETKKLATQALNRAVRFYYDAGYKQLLEQRKRHSYTEAEMVEQKSRYFPYYINRAKELAIKDHIEKLKAAKTTGKVA